MPAQNASVQMAHGKAFAPSGTAADWAVVAFGMGCALYFGLGAEPPIAGLVIAVTVLGALTRFWNGRVWVTVALMLAIGVGRAAWHSHAASHTVLPERALTYDVTGWIEGVERGSRGLRWIVRVQAMEGVGEPPPRIRVNAGEREGVAGQGVRLRARLYAPPAPALPGGYDSARAAWFRGIGAYGQVYEVEPVDMETGLDESVSRAVVRWRYGIAARIRERAPPETAGLQAALITGVRHGITEAQYGAMRDAGLAHIVAISGLHMSAFAGTTYLLLCGAFALTPAGRRRDMRKWAAGAAIGMASIYLVLSGASVSTQRAFIMITVWLLAVIMERQPFSLRSVSVAALVTLFIHPESILSAGFHMSFAAVAALIVAYGWWNARGERLPTSRARRVVNGFGSIAATSAIAGTATAGYALLHFGRLARYGLSANLAAMPLFTFVTMPAAMLALLLMPVGLEAVPLTVMGWSLSAVLWVAESVAAWPGAVFYAPGAGTLALVVFSAGLVMLLLGRTRVRLAGLVTLTAVPLTAYLEPHPASGCPTGRW